MDEKQQQMRFADDFMRNTKRTHLDGGRLRIACRKGLWSVEGPSADALREAHHYFGQYWHDGEYALFASE